MKNFNKHVGNSVNGFEGVHGGYCWVKQNQENKRIMDLADSFDMVEGKKHLR